MSFGIYEAKRLLRKPLIWYGRRRHAGASEGEKWRLEHNAYRRVAMKAAGNVSIDPHFFYRADLDSSSIAIDIGAFRGHVAEQLYELYGCRLYAFEPSPQFYPELESRFVDNPKVETRPYGLGSTDATMSMQLIGLGSTVTATRGLSAALMDARIDSLRRRLGNDTAFVRAPGRVNLIGDHTDYQDGLCLPVAIDRDVIVAFRPRVDGRVVVDSVDLPDPAAVRPMVDAVLAALARRGRPATGFDAAVASTVPIGSGLSSSAAFEVAIALAALGVAGHALDGRELARAAQEAEHVATGVPCGVMDQMASVFGRAEHALLLDCRAVTIDPIALPRSVAIVVVHSGLPRQLAASAYAARRAACEAAAVRIGVAALRDATLAQVVDDPIARHVVTENGRVLRFVDALRADDPAACGRLMLESHASLRDDFGVSTPELDHLVDLAMDHDAFGARLTGAGFGGCIVALVAPGAADAFASTIADRYRAETGYEPTAFVTRAVEGAGSLAPR